MLAAVIGGLDAWILVIIVVLAGLPHLPARRDVPMVVQWMEWVWFFAVLPTVILLAWLLNANGHLAVALAVGPVVWLGLYLSRPALEMRDDGSIGVRGLGWETYSSAMATGCRVVGEQRRFRSGARLGLVIDDSTRWLPFVKSPLRVEDRQFDDLQRALDKVLPQIG